MDSVGAARVLGVSVAADAATLRGAYRRALMESHPDLSSEPGAHHRTTELTAAYRLLMALDREKGIDRGDGATREPLDDRDEGSEHAQPPGRSAGPAPFRRAEPPCIRLAMSDPTTITADASTEEVFMLVLDAAHRLGEVSYLDPRAGLLEVIIEFVDAPTSSVVLMLQGRSGGVDVSCGVEPLSGGVAPASDAVTQLVLRTLCEDPRVGS